MVHALVETNAKSFSTLHWSSVVPAEGDRQNADGQIDGNSYLKLLNNYKQGLRKGGAEGANALSIFGNCANYVTFQKFARIAHI